MQTYQFIVTHPLLWVFLGLLVTFYLITWTTGLELKNGTAPNRWLRRHYVSIILAAVACLAVLALSFYLVEIGISVAALVDRLRHAAGDSETPSIDMRNLAYAVAVLVGVLAATTTVFFSSIRVWINERTATATEEGLITDRINKAVEGLGAEKTITYKGRFIHWNLDAEGRENRGGFLHRWGENPDIKHRLPPHLQGKSERELAFLLTFGDWTDITETTANLEVRIGAIFALERIAQDSDRDHVQIMEILCAYIRHNAPADPEIAFPQEWQAAFDSEEIDMRVKRPSSREIYLWAIGLKKPREDIQVALTVIGRRSDNQTRLEGQRDKDGEWRGYSLDLRNTCLKRADMAGKEFSNARLEEAQLLGADLSGAQLQGADLSKAQLQGANLSTAQLQGADLSRAQMQGTDLHEGQLHGADLSMAQMQRSVFRGAQLQEATIVRAKMQEANLVETQMQWADLEEAQMQKAALRGAQMQWTNLVLTQLQGANLSSAQMQGADLRWAQIDSSTNLTGTTLRGAAFREVDYKHISISQSQIDEVFGDATVELPNTISPPKWFDERKDFDAFYEAWRAWQKESGFDPEKPDG